MSQSSSPFIHPTENELALAGQTVLQTHRDISPVRDRLAAAASFLRSVEKPPAEPSLVFARERSAAFEAVAIGAGLTVGRGKESSLCLEQCAALSRRHFGVRPESDMWLLEDLGSRNGTMVDGMQGRITRHLLRDGDIVFAGDLMFLFVTGGD